MLCDLAPLRNASIDQCQSIGYCRYRDWVFLSIRSRIFFARKFPINPRSGFQQLASRIRVEVNHREEDHKNPVNVSSDEKSSYGTAAPVTGAYAATAATPVVGTTQANTAVGAESIPVIQEDLQVGKRRVLRGGIRVFSRVVETPVQENVELREETVRVNRQAVNRPATEADFATGRNQAIEVEQYGEEAVVGKKARVVEEVQVGKEVSDRTETVKDSLRHTEIEVEQLSADKFQTKTTGK